MHMVYYIASVLSLVIVVQSGEIISKVPSDGNNLSGQVVSPVNTDPVTRRTGGDGEGGRNFMVLPLPLVRVDGQISRMNSRMNNQLNGRLSKMLQVIPSSDSIPSISSNLRRKRQVYYDGYDGFYDGGYYHHGALWDYGYPAWYSHHW